MLAKPDRRKWTRWIDRVSQELVRSSEDREVFRQWEGVVKTNPRLDINGRFMAFIWSNYFDSQVLVVRRQVKRDKQAISLVGLLHEIASYADQLTRDVFLRNNPVDGHRLFDQFAGRGNARVSSALVITDADRLVKLSSKLVYRSDKWLAHSDRHRRWPRVGFRQLDRALDTLYSTWHRYHVLVRGGPIAADPVALAEQDWQWVFEIPWRTAGGKAG